VYVTTAVLPPAVSNGSTNRMTMPHAANSATIHNNLRLSGRTTPFEALMVRLLQARFVGAPATFLRSLLERCACRFLHFSLASWVSHHPPASERTSVNWTPVAARSAHRPWALPQRQSWRSSRRAYRQYFWITFRNWIVDYAAFWEIKGCVLEPDLARNNFLSARDLGPIAQASGVGTSPVSTYQKLVSLME